MKNGGKFVGKSNIRKLTYTYIFNHKHIIFRHASAANDSVKLSHTTYALSYYNTASMLNKPIHECHITS